MSLPMKRAFTAFMRLQLILLVLGPGLGLGLAAGASRAEIVPLDRIKHIHGLAVDPARPERLYLATHDGIFLATPNGAASRIGTANADFMSFAMHPTDPEVLYASGHPRSGGNLGFLTSPDGGVTWLHRSPGLGGPVDFHVLDVSRADPEVIYGIYNGLQVSRDGGQTWQMAGPLPANIYDLATSARDAGTLYAGAKGGFFRSRDGGATWTLAYVRPLPTPMVQVSAAGRVFAFVYGVGLVAGDEPGTGWEVLSQDFDGRYVTQLAIDPGDPNRLHAVADTGAVLTSKDGGRTWASYAGHLRETPEIVAEGRRLYEELCQSCHGAKAVGERPDDMYAKDDYGVVAPPLDDSAHGWHHSDSNLTSTILTGSPRNPRMMTFKALVSEDEARNIVAYLKSLWSFRSLACQGARHMSCM